MHNGEMAHPAPRSSTSMAGFTLLEMLVVMSLIGLLLTLAVPRYFGSIQRSKEAVLVHNLQAMRTAIDRFHADKGRLPDSLDELVDRRYLRNVPVDPLTESDTTWVVVPPEQADEGLVFDVHSGAAGNDSAGVPYEQL